MPVIYLIRHGQASFGKEDYDQLSEPGWEQSRILGRALQNQDLGVARPICGTMRRHRETAEAALGELGLPAEWHTDTGFNEYNHTELLALDWPMANDRAALTEWLGKQANPRKVFQVHFEQALRRWQRNDDSDRSAYSETWPAFRERVLASTYSLGNSLSSGESALVFTSGGAISVIIQHLLDMDDEALITWNRTLINTSVTRILVNAGKLRLVSVNEHLHLPSDQVTYR
ncbi:MAG: histidine phosphatase family protein [Alcanivoracaceae bacterium]|uniref:histidine phosphatase family protein n=1 Tax=Alcanivorax sp. MD8A TaxID=1177157 RepID=UPI000C38311F|nr:histidine phosphatase family protein [Alcanivorax sp. MD8A]MAX56306.1 histidine phosphatase family protein [Alcanivoracaceae bacterium]MCG8439378.1 histidine phosphatase family protein [Pseudomonadales bacterium]PNE01892.1 phosphoglycerate mutase [Alcanivorax sp. MD8A]|tara:strand:- start:373 stop:1062 length:690 start_codon:yes stop_codon:yes gene_type:complete